MISDIEIPLISFDEMYFEEHDLLSSTSDHVVDDSSGPLYPGTIITTFQATSILTLWFSLYPGITKSAFDCLLNVLHKHNILPVGNHLPESYSNAHKSVNSFLTPVKEYHCCINDCVVYATVLPEGMLIWIHAQSVMSHDIRISMERFP